MLQKGVWVWFVDTDVKLNDGVMYELGQGEILDMDTLHYHQSGETHWVVRWADGQIESHSPAQLLVVSHDV